MIRIPIDVAVFVVASAMPAGKAIAGVLLFGSAALMSLTGLFADRETLLAMSDKIGTEKPLAARIVCGIGAVVCTTGVVVCVLALLDVAD